MTQDTKTVSRTAGAHEAADLLEELCAAALPVVDTFDRVIGVVTASAVDPGRRRGPTYTNDAAGQTVGDVMIPVDGLPTEDASLVDLAGAFLSHDLLVVPIVYADTGQLAGVVSHRDLLHAFRSESEAGSSIRAAATPLYESGRRQITVDTFNVAISTNAEVVAKIESDRRIDAVCADLAALARERRRRPRGWRSRQATRSRRLDTP